MLRIYGDVPRGLDSRLGRRLALDNGIVANDRCSRTNNSDEGRKIAADTR
jgi:hypothetical protein